MLKDLQRGIIHRQYVEDVVQIAESIRAETESGISRSLLARVYKVVRESSLIRRKIDATGSTDKLRKRYDEHELVKSDLKRKLSILIDSDGIGVFSGSLTPIDRISSSCNTLSDIKKCGIFGKDSIFNH